MTELEKYIRDHAAAFDTESPTEGHEARFLARLDASPACLPPAGGRKLFFGFLSRKTNFRSALHSAFARQAPSTEVFLPGRPLGAGRSQKNATPRHLAAPAFAFVCALLLVLVIRPGDPFRGVSNEPEAIYLAYMDRVADLYQALPLEDSTLQDITEEADPLFVQLPDNISSRQRGRILKNHYGELLAAARQLKNNQ